MSCRISHASLSGVVFASSIMLVSMLMGTCVEVLFRTEQLFPSRMLLTLHFFSSLEVSSFVNSFLAVFMSTIGLVISTFLFQFFSLGIRMVLVFFQVLGIFL